MMEALRLVVTIKQVLALFLVFFFSCLTPRSCLVRFIRELIWKDPSCQRNGYCLRQARVLARSGARPVPHGAGPRPCCSEVTALYSPGNQQTVMCRLKPHSI